jgi:hypothetical protein
MKRIVLQLKQFLCYALWPPPPPFPPPCHPTPPHPTLPSTEPVCALLLSSLVTSSRLVVFTS